MGFVLTINERVFNMKKLFLFLAISAFAGILTACATVMRDNNQAIPIKANVEKVV